MTSRGGGGVPEPVMTSPFVNEFSSLSGSTFKIEFTLHFESYLAFNDKSQITDKKSMVNSLFNL